MIMEDYFLIGFFALPVIIFATASLVSIIYDFSHNHN